MNARVQPVAVAEVKASPFATHEVRNQARPATGFNAFEDDRALSGLIAKLAPWARDKLSALGAHAGSEAAQEAAKEGQPKTVDDTDAAEVVEPPAGADGPGDLVSGDKDTDVIF